MADMNTEMGVSERKTHPRVPETIGRGIELYLRVADRLASALWAIAIAMATILTLIIVSQVVSRYVLGYITTWGNELARYLMIWFAMLLLGVLIYEDSHLQVELAFQKLSSRRRRMLRSGQLLALAGFGSLLADYGLRWTMISGFYSTTPALESVTPFTFHMAYVYVVVPISGLLIMFFSIGKLLEINYYPETIERDYQARFDADDEASDADGGGSLDGTADVGTDGGAAK
jgi:TRAP-type C4-dicarboxylate transport system permease small subunit